MDDELVAPADHLKIGKNNLRLSSILKSKEPTLQVALDALKLTSFYNAFEISTDVPEIYMQEFWVTISRHHSLLRFKLNGKSHTVNIDNFRDMLKIFPKLPGQIFEEPPLEDEILSFIRDIGHTVSNGKNTALESLRLLCAQILWGMYHNKTVDYVYLLWEDLVYQVENKNSKKNNDMYYPRFTKVIVGLVMAKVKGLQNQKLQKKKLILIIPKDEGLLKLLKGARYKLIALTSMAQVMELTLSQRFLMSSTNEGAGEKPKVPDVPEYRSKSEEESWTFSQGEDDEENDEHDSEDDNDEHESDNDNDDEDDDQENVSGETQSDDDGYNFVHPNLSTYKADDQEKEKEEEKANDDDEVSSDQMVSTPPDYEITEEEENQEDDDNVMGGEQEDEEDEELYGDLNLNLERRDAEMTDAQVNQEKEEVHVTFTTELPVVQQQSSSVSSDLVSKFMNPTPDTGIDSILNPNIQSDIPVNVSVSITTTTPSSDTTIPQTPILIIQPQQQTHDSTTTTTIPATTLPNIPNFASLFDSNIKAIIKDQVKAQVSKIMPKVEKYVTESLGAERGREDQEKDEEPSAGSNRGKKRSRSGKEESSKEATQKESKSTSSSKGKTSSQPKSSGKSAQAEEHGPRVDDLEEPSHQEFNTSNDDVSPARETVDDRTPQSWMTQLAQTSGTQSTFNEFLATPIDFYAFIMNRLKINNLTQDVLTGLTYDLIKGTCKRVVELEYHLEENARSRQVIPFDHFINNDLEYLKGGSLSQRYTTSITKTKAAEYGHVKWIEDKVPRSDFKRLRRQDIEDMLLLLVQGKLTNLNLDEWFALNVALRMYTRRIVIQERVEDLQLAVESYQKKINLSKPDSYRSDLRKMTPYTAYPDIQGIIYQDDMDKNRLMRTDELHKFSEGTLNRSQ
ncbi:hypothetical protein Tco_1392681 [Tanacetum coccineum]